MSEFEKWYGRNCGDPYDAPKDRYKAMQEAFKAGALTARSEGFREGVEAAARVCKKAADDLYEFAEEQRKVGQARVAADNESKAATAKVLENHIRALSPRETDAPTREESQQDWNAVLSDRKSAPSGEVAEMVKRVEESAQYWLKGGRAETDRAKAVMFVEQAMNAYKNAMYALLAKVGQGWVPEGKSKRLNCKPPEWTVCYNIVSKESDAFVGTGWEFFHDRDSARKCYERHSSQGNVPTLRPYYPGCDSKHLGAAHHAFLDPPPPERP